MSGYAGLPLPADVAAQLRHHAQKVADGTVERPTRAILLSYNARGELTLTPFGPDYGTHREAIADLLNATIYLNAEASH